MPTLYQEALRQLNAEISRTEGEIAALPWYRYFKRESLTREKEDFETRRTHLRAEQCYPEPESTNNDSYMILLQKKYEQSSPAHRDVLYSIVYGNPQLQG
jgi:hypothetical protein